MNYDQTQEFLASIEEGSLEQDALLWFENVPYHKQAAAHVKMEMEIRRLRAVIKQAEAQIYAILRGQHNGWDRALADVRETLRGAR